MKEGRTFGDLFALLGTGRGEVTQKKSLARKEARVNVRRQRTQGGVGREEMERDTLTAVFQPRKRGLKKRFGASWGKVALRG